MQIQTNAVNIAIPTGPSTVVLEVKPDITCKFSGAFTLHNKNGTLEQSGELKGKKLKAVFDVRKAMAPYELRIQGGAFLPPPSTDSLVEFSCTIGGVNTVFFRAKVKVSNGVMQTLLPEAALV